MDPSNVSLIALWYSNLQFSYSQSLPKVQICLASKSPTEYQTQWVGQCKRKNMMN